MNDRRKATDFSQRIASLSPEKLALLTLRLQERQGAAPPRPPSIEPRPRSEAPELSFAQQRLWFIEQLSPGGSTFNVPTAVRLTGRLNLAALERTVNEVVRRHEVLRASFPATDGKPRQVVLAEHRIELRPLDLSGRAEPGEAVAQLALAEARRPFDLARGPLLRVTLLKLGEQEHVLILTMHHIVSDAWSVGVLIREVTTLYRAFSARRPSPLPELPIQYADFARWQREWWAGEARGEQLAYWERQLAGSLQMLALPADRPRPAVQTFRGAARSFVLPRGLADRLAALSRREGATLFMTLLAAFKVLLLRYTGQEDIIVGTDIANRTHAETESLIGFFVNQLVLRTDCAGDPPFRDLLGRVRTVALGAYAHQDMPFEQLVAALRPERSLSHTPLFQVKFVLQNAPEEQIDLPGLALKPLPVHHGSVGFDLILSLNETPSGLEGSLDYSTDLFEAETVDRLVGHYRVLLESIVADPEANLSRLEMLTPEERRQLLTVFNGTAAAYPAGHCAHELFEAHAARDPEAIAVTFGDARLTYGELNCRANQLAHYLRDLGVGPEVRVGIFAERTPAMIVGILGVLKAGGAYVPLDPSYPLERLSLMLDDAQAPVVITEERLLDRLPAGWAQIFCLDTDWELAARASAANSRAWAGPGNAAYVIYTSGTTGRPKGVVVEHRGLANLVSWQGRHFGINHGSRISQFASYSFDAAVGETFMALANGASLVLLDRDCLAPDELVKAVNDHRIDVLVMVPSILKELDPSRLRAGRGLTVVAVGEACPPELALRWGGRCRFMNAYGPTEYTVYSHLWVADEEYVSETGRVPVGKPIDNTQTYILDSHDNPVPIGVEGEIYIAGPGIARGYQNHPGLTAEKFVPNRFRSGELPLESAAAEIAEFKRTHARPTLDRRQRRSREEDYSPAQIRQLVAGLDPDLIEQTWQMASALSRESVAYRGFCRYLLEGMSESYASGGINREALSALLPYPDFRSLRGVDFGFGNGEIMRHLSAAGAKMTGLDFNPFFVQRGRADGLDVRMARVDLSPEIFFRESGLAAGSQDFAVSTLLLDRLEKPKAAVSNLFLTLKEGGRFAIQTLLPIVGRDDGEVADPITYTLAEDQIGTGSDAEGDRQALTALLGECGASGVQLHRLPYIVASGDGLQEYQVWSFVGRKGAGAEDGRLYRTGDRGRFLPDGNIEFRGRVDSQVKVRGFRIEPGEIEAHLSAHLQVRDCAVVAAEAGQGRKQLKAYVVAGDDPAPTADELQRHLRDRLPDYMVPSSFVLLDRLPLTPNGKIDHQQLASAGSPEAAPGADFIAPRTPIERLLAEAWAQVLGRERVGVRDNIFEIGGDSILIIQILARVNQAGLQLTVSQFFKHQTIAELAKVAGGAPPVLAAQGVVTGPVELTPIQRWFFERDQPDPHHYNQSLLLQTSAALEIEPLARAIEQVVAHHDALRLRFKRGAAGWEQSHASEVNGDLLCCVDLSGRPEPEQAAAIEEHAAEVQAGLDLGAGPLLRCTLYDLGLAHAQYLLIVVHHLAVDAVSWRFILEDLQTAYEQLRRGDRVELPSKTTSFQAWSERLAQHAQSPELLRELDYWTAESRARVSRLPVDYSGGEHGEDSSRTIAVSLGEEETRLLAEQIPAVYRAQAHEALLTALAAALSSWSGGGPVLIDLEGHGREDILDGVDVSRTVGWFTSLFPAHLGLSLEAPPAARLLSVKEQLRRVPNRGVGYGLLRYLHRDAAVGEKLRALPQAEVSFNYLGQSGPAESEGGQFAAAGGAGGPGRSPAQRRDYLLGVTGSISRGRLRLELEYSERLHRRPTIEALARGVIDELRAIIAAARAAARAHYSPSDFPLAQEVLERLEPGQVDWTLAPDGQGVEAVYPLTPLQQGMLYHSLYAPESGVYFNQVSCALRGLDVAAFERAWGRVIGRHAVLRTGFVWEGVEEPLQVVRPEIDLPLAREDWREFPRGEQESRLEAFLREDRARGFRLIEAPLMRLTLCRLSADSYYFVWSFHHLLTDGWSVSLLMRELFACYEAARRGEDAPLEASRPFAEYIAWLRRQDTSQAEAFWRRELRGMTAPTPLGVDRAPADASQVGHYREQTIHLPVAVTTALQEQARRHRLTLNTLVQGAWALLLARYSGEQDVVFGTVVSGRPPALAGSEAMVGLFINTLPVRARVRPDELLGPWLGRLQALQAELREYEYSSLVQVQGWSEVPRSAPLFNSVLIFENYPVDQALASSDAGLNVDLVRAQEQTNYPITVVAEPGEQLTLRIAFDRALVDDGAAARALGHLQTLLGGMAESLEQPLAALPVMTEAEGRRLLSEWNDTGVEYGGGQLIHRLFEAQAGRTPEAIALADDKQRLTYRELNRRANQLAHYLQACGVGPEVLVGVCAEHSVELVIALLGILKAGGAYVPLPPSYPKERLHFMLEDARVSLLLTQEKLLAGLPPRSARTICLDRDRDLIARADEGEPASRVFGDHPAYVIYTSGSTGRPKGVVGLHGATVNRFNWMWDAFPFAAGEVCAHKTTLGFVDAVWEIFGPLLRGVRLEILADQVAKDPRRLVEALAARRVTRIVLVPSLLRALLDAEDDLGGQLPALRLWVSSGEGLPAELARRFRESLPRATLLNLYGSSEVSADVSCCNLSRHGLADTIVPIGRPIPNTQIYLLDRRLDPVPIGVAGEVYVGGANLARGYLGRPELTAERFLPDPFSREPGARLYRTGDQGRYLPDGNLELLGRLDRQIKVRGMRVEAAEVEAALNGHPAISESYVVAWESGDGGQSLAAYYCAAEGAAALTVSELREALREQIPEFMIPAAFVQLDALPLTPSGKVDRQSLPRPDASHPRLSHEPVPPRSATERTIAAVWRQALRLEQVGVHDNFFDLGGHSLILVNVQHRLREELGADISLVELFNRPTISALASYLGGGEGSGPDFGRSAARGARRRERRPPPGRAVISKETDS